MSVSFYSCFPVANQKLHTKCLLRRRIKKNDNSPVSRTPQNSFYSAKSTAQIPFQHMLTISMSVMFDLPPRWPSLILRLQQTSKSSKRKITRWFQILPLSSKVHIYHAVGWVGKPKIFTSPLACRLVWSGEASCWSRSCYCDCFDVSCDEQPSWERTMSGGS